MKRVWIVTTLTALVVLLLFSLRFSTLLTVPRTEVMKVGFIYEDDESTPGTYNFALAQERLEKIYGSAISIMTKSNVLGSEMDEPVIELVRRGCNVIFTNCHGEGFMELAAQYPKVEFCQVSASELAGKEYPPNFHTFNGAIYEGRYVSGVAAGLKLREMIDNGVIRPEQALAGFVGPDAVPEVISAYTAFLLGIRSVVPEAVIKVRYTGSWRNFTKEKEIVRELIREGCVVISHYCSTAGPAVACEEMSGDSKVIYIGYHQGLTDIAPTAALISTRVNWTPYITAAVEAIRNNESIEDKCGGTRLQDRDVIGDFSDGWIQILDLNPHLAPYNMQITLDETIKGLTNGSIAVFSGDYTGVNPEDPKDVCDLKVKYQENRDFSAPSFHYVLDDVVEVEQ